MEKYFGFFNPSEKILHPGSFYYPEIERLPRIASVKLTKVKEFKLRKEFKAVVETKKDSNRIEDWSLARDGGGHWQEEKKRSRRREKDWGLKALQGHGLVVGDLNVRDKAKEALYSKILSIYRGSTGIQHRKRKLRRARKKVFILDGNGASCENKSASFQRERKARDCKVTQWGDWSRSELL